MKLSEGIKAQSSSKYWDKAWSLVEGCTPVSEACDNCWLASITNRFGKHDPSPLTYATDNKIWFSGQVRIRPDRLDIPLKRKKPTVYAIWSDLFHEAVSFEFINKAYKVMCEASQHTFLILTKRPDRMKAWVLMYLRRTGQPKIWSHIYIGVTAENQERADERIPVLLSIPAAKRFVSIEPMLGEIDLLKTNHSSIEDENWNGMVTWLEHLDWIIVGGESGRHARPIHPAWARSVRDQCQVAGVPFFFKQWGEWHTDEIIGKASALCARW